MQAANCKPDVISYNSALGALDRAGKGKEERVTWAAKKSAGLGSMREKSRTHGLEGSNKCKSMVKFEGFPLNSD